jgi:hypothetical protein
LALGNPVPAYDPKASFNKIRHAGALPWDPVVAGVDALGSPAVPKRPAGANVARPAIETGQPAAAQAGSQVMP